MADVEHPLPVSTAPVPELEPDVSIFSTLSFRWPKDCWRMDSLPLLSGGNIASDSIPRALSLSALTVRYLSRKSFTPSMTGTERLRPHVPSHSTCCTNMVDLSPIM